MRKYWQSVDGSWYYFSSDGAMRTKWLKISNQWYYFGDSGAAVTDWLLSGGKWFYFDYIDYTMETGSREIDGANYNFREDGSLIE